MSERGQEKRKEVEVQRGVGLHTELLDSLINFGSSCWTILYCTLAKEEGGE